MDVEAKFKPAFDVVSVFVIREHDGGNLTYKLVIAIYTCMPGIRAGRFRVRQNPLRPIPDSLPAGTSRADFRDLLLPRVPSCTLQNELCPFIGGECTSACARVAIE